MYSISGKGNPADIMTKAVDKATIERLLPYLYGNKEIPLPDGLKIWFGPYCEQLVAAGLIWGTYNPTN